MDENDRNRETREQQRLDRLGTNDPVCCICGESDSRCLEMHHVAGRQFDDQLVIVCRNCHRKASDDQKDHPARINKDTPPSFDERLAHFLVGLADFFILLAQRLKEFAKELIERVRGTSQQTELQS